MLPNIQEEVSENGIEVVVCKTKAKKNLFENASWIRYFKKAELNEHDLTITEFDLLKYSELW